MRIQNFLIAAILAISGVTQAQVSKSDFEKAVNFVNCKAVELSLKKSPTGGVTSLFKGKCNCETYPDFNSIKSAIASTETKTIDLSIEIDKVKTNAYKQSIESDDAIRLLTEGIFSNQTKYSKLFEFANKRKDDPAFLSLKEVLKNDLEKFLVSQPQENSNVEPNTDSDGQQKPPSLENRVATLEQKQDTAVVETKGWFSEHINYFVCIALLFSIIAVIVAMIKGRKSENRSSSDSDDAYDTVISKILSGRRFGDHIQGELNKRVNTKDIIKSVISELKPEIAKLVEQQQQNETTVEWNVTPQENFSKQELKQPETKTPTETFYLSTPNSDGSFNESSASPSYREGASIYRFTKVANSSKAKFQIDDREASIKLALQYPDKNIDPVCDAINAFNPKAKRIVTDSAGEAELTGDKWIKNSKAKIKYES